MNNPNSIPSGYAEVSDPKDAPVGREKCWPMVGVRGDVMVNPRRLSVVAVRIARMERLVFVSVVVVVNVVVVVFNVDIVVVVGLLIVVVELCSVSIDA